MTKLINAFKTLIAAGNLNLIVTCGRFMTLKCINNNGFNLFKFLGKLSIKNLLLSTKVHLVAIQFQINSNISSWRFYCNKAGTYLFVKSIIQLYFYSTLCRHCNFSNSFTFLITTSKGCWTKSKWHRYITFIAKSLFYDNKHKGNVVSSLKNV